MSWYVRQFITWLAPIVLAMAALTLFQLQVHEPYVTQPIPPPATPAAAPANRSQLQHNINELLALVDTHNPRLALQELAKRMQVNSEVFKNCHGIAHTIGHEAYKKYRDFVIALQYQDSVCSDGYLHGIIEERFSYATSVTALAKEMSTICHSAVVAAGRCYHGVGHGLMYFTGNDLPQAIHLCGRYKGAPQSRCFEGVFMENFISDDIIHPSSYRSKEALFYPCPTEPSGLKSYCYFYVPYFYRSLHGNDYSQALAWCTTAERAGVLPCIRGVGSLVMKNHLDQPSYAEHVCSQLPTKQAPYCIDGMVSYYLTFYDHLDLAENMCDHLAVSNQPACRSAIVHRDKLFAD